MRSRRHVAGAHGRPISPPGRRSQRRAASAGRGAMTVRSPSTVKLLVDASMRIVPHAASSPNDCCGSVTAWEQHQAAKKPRRARRVAVVLDAVADPEHGCSPTRVAYAVVRKDEPRARHTGRRIGGSRRRAPTSASAHVTSAPSTCKGTARARRCRDRPRRGPSSFIRAQLAARCRPASSSSARPSGSAGGRRAARPATTARKNVSIERENSNGRLDARRCRSRGPRRSCRGRRRRKRALVPGIGIQLVAASSA